jgi:phosphatidylglycerophosphate synthase
LTLQEVRALARKRPEQEFALNRLYGAHVSPFFTVVCLRLGLSPDQVTIIGGTLGAIGVALLFLPVQWWSIVAVVCLQMGYILDFSDGQVARLSGRTSVAGSYLDWLTHFYIPVAMALAAATSVAWASGWMIFLVLGTLAALELAAFAFSCKEHVLISMQRQDPTLGTSAAFHAALRDDARPADVDQAAPGPAGFQATHGVAGRAQTASWRSMVGELLIYPGSVHLMTLAVLTDLLLQWVGLGPATFARSTLLVVWALLMPLHVFSTARRNHRLIRAVEARGRSTGGKGA